MMILFYYCSLLFTAAAAVEEYTFALIPKSTSNPFFTLVYEGCESRANDRSSSSSSSSSPMNITCRFIGPYNESATEQVTIIDDLIAGIKYGPVNGISVSVVDSNILTPAINRAIEAGIPVITFDSDAVNSTRKSYVGTDNFAFGEELGKLLTQVKPEGGMYGVIAASAPNVVERYNGINDKLAEDSNWTPILDTYLDCEDNTAIALEQMNDFVNMGVQAIIPVGFWPMGDKESWIDFVDANTNITLIVGDSLEVQMELMNMGYVDGLVGQLPFEMGKDSIDVLLKLANDEDVGMINYGTSILEVLRFPLVLPPINDGNGVNNNYIGTLSILGYLIYALIVASSLFLMVWTHLYKETRVVKASQPFFLQMIIGGIVIFSSAIIPLSIDDQKSSQKSCDMACMATPWLLTIGFTTTFSALFAKTWRVNKIFHNPNAFKRIKVTEKDVIQPYLVMMGINLIVLICWTVISPLKYKRNKWPGTDLWNRIIATYGSCQEEENPGDFWPYLSIILVVNIGILIVANLQSYQARLIQTEYSESHYITIIMASLAQMFLLAVPCVTLLSKQPRPYYVVMVIVILCVSAAVLGLMFVPKINATRIWLKEKAAKEEKKAAMRASVVRPASTFSDSGGIGLKIAIMPKKSQIWKGFTMSRINDPPIMPPVGNESGVKEDSTVSDDGLKFRDMSGQNLNYVPEKKDVVAPSREVCASSTRQSIVSFKDSVTSEIEDDDVDDDDGLKFEMSEANLNYIPEKEVVVAPSQEMSHASSTRSSSVRFQEDALEEEKDEVSNDANSIPESVLYGEDDDIQSLEQALDVIKTLRERLKVE